MLTAARCQAANGWNAPFKGIFSRRGAEDTEKNFLTWLRHRRNQNL